MYENFCPRLFDKYLTTSVAIVYRIKASHLLIITDVIIDFCILCFVGEKEAIKTTAMLSVIRTYAA